MSPRNNQKKVLKASQTMASGPKSCKTQNLEWKQSIIGGRNLVYYRKNIMVDLGPTPEGHTGDFYETG